jgi:hypothetical protein
MPGDGSSISKIDRVNAADVICVAFAAHFRVARYLMGLSHCCLEVAQNPNPRLVGVLFGVLKLAPKTLLELARAPGG